MKIYSLLLVYYSILFSNAHAQKGYSTGEVISNFPITRSLNYSSDSLRFVRNDKPLIFLDFFGTWCVPCIKALPHLTYIQQQYKEQVEVVLVSIEEAAKLKQFADKQKDFRLPIIIDEGSNISSVFQPPSYPYTVIINKEGKILATTTDVHSITNQTIQNWLDHKTTSQATAASPTPILPTMAQPTTTHLLKLAQELVYAAKTQSPTKPLETQLQNISLSELQKALPSDADKKAFWINIYNGYTSLILKKAPEIYKKRNRFFSARQITIAGQTFSLDAIEHDILRRSKVKWGLGHLNKWFPSKLVKQLRVDQLDYRIHFALNCGAKSCPPIAYYSSDKLDQQLDLATKNYLRSEVVYDSSANLLQLPAIMSWFRGDFGGKKGMIDLLQKQHIIPANSRPRMQFKKYDWTLELNNYKTDINE